MASGENNEEEYYSSPEEADDDDDDQMSFRSASNDSDAGESDGDDDAMDADDDDYGDEDALYDDDDDGDYGEEEEDNVVLADQRERKERYAVLTMDAVRARQEEHTAMVADLVALPPALAAAVLRHFKWSTAAVEEHWFAEEQRIRDAVGVPPCSAAGVATNAEPLTCLICFDVHPAGAMRSAGCAAHFYCRGCWGGYVRAAVGDGARCLSIRCPDTSCSAAVMQDLVDDVADPGDATRYAELLLRSYVEESKKLQWCPAPWCDHAVEFLDGERCIVQLDADCACGHGFCLNCGEEAHRPVSCDTVRAWQVKHASDSETANWVLVNTKHCPQCRKPIEKNQGCMHMTCREPCKHQFCWLCLGPWSSHGKDNGGFYQCNKYQAAKLEGKFSDEEVRRQQAKASVDKYVHYLERWESHERSRNKALEDLAALQLSGGKLEEAAAAFGVQVTQLDFIKDAYRQVAECRRMLRWTYAFGFFVEEPAKRELFEMLQSDAEISLERLHGAAEKERTDMVAPPDPVYDEDDKLVPPVAAPAADKYAEYRQRLSSLTLVTRDHFENMARAFRDGLAEVDTAAAAANAVANAAKTAERKDPVAFLVECRRKSPDRAVEM